MRHTALFLILLSLCASCNWNNPDYPEDTAFLANELQWNFALSKPSYGVYDTVVATTTVYNPGPDSVEYTEPVCWPISSWSIRDSVGKIRVHFTLTLACMYAADRRILAHQTQGLGSCTIKVPIAALGDSLTAPGRYVFTTNEFCGTFSGQFIVQ